MAFLGPLFMFIVAAIVAGLGCLVGLEWLDKMDKKEKAVKAAKKAAVEPATSNTTSAA